MKCLLGGEAASIFRGDFSHSKGLQLIGGRQIRNRERPGHGSVIRRLEVGTAHRRVVNDTIQLSNHTLVMNPDCFVNAAPVGGAHL